MGTILERFFLLLIFLLIIFILFFLGDVINNYRLSKFKNLAYTIATTKSRNCDKSSCHVSYVYVVDGQIYGGSADKSDELRYPNTRYYVVYSTDDPTLQIILPDYSVNKPLVIDSIPKEYISERMECYLGTDTKEGWGNFMWHGTFDIE